MRIKNASYEEKNKGKLPRTRSLLKARVEIVLLTVHLSVHVVEGFTPEIAENHFK
jgi:hypothetical protein